MKYPLRLSFDLLRYNVSRAFASGRNTSAILHLSPAVFPSTDQKEIEAESNPNAAGMEIPAQAVSLNGTPVVWVGGEEPLEHPTIGRISAALNQQGRNVFLHTSGVRLRQRIHEFRPDPRLFLTVELAGREEIHDRFRGQPGAFRRAMEGIRVAKLSGFHVCAHVSVNAETEVCEAGGLFELLDRHDVDGFIVSSGGRATGAGSGAEFREKLEQVRSLVRCGRWEKFSSLLEASYAAPREKASAMTMPDSGAGACEESA
jgi:MoaA/NifB/PqqE/SkfB family radical SAM enzyme